MRSTQHLDLARSIGQDLVDDDNIREKLQQEIEQKESALKLLTSVSLNFTDNHRKKWLPEQTKQFKQLFFETYLQASEEKSTLTLESKEIDIPAISPESLNATEFQVEQGDLQIALNILRSLSGDESRSLEKKLKNSSSMLSWLEQLANTDNAHPSKQLSSLEFYKLLCILTCVIHPYFYNVKISLETHSPIILSSHTETDDSQHEALRIKTNRTNALKLMHQWLGQERKIGLLLLNGATTPLFQFEWVMPMFLLPQKSAVEYAWGVFRLWEASCGLEETRANPKLSDIHFLHHYLTQNPPTHQTNLTDFRVRGLDGDSGDFSGNCQKISRDFYISPLSSHPAERVSNLLKWLRIHDIHTQTNAKAAYQAIEHMDWLTNIHFDKPVTKQFKQQIFEVVLSVIHQMNRPVPTVVKNSLFKQARTVSSSATNSSPASEPREMRGSGLGSWVKGYFSP